MISHGKYNSIGLFNTPHLKNKNLPRTNLEQKPLQDSTCIYKLDC